MLAGASELSDVEVRFDGKIRGFSPSDTFETVLCKFGIDTRLFPELRVMPNGGARLQVNLEDVLASCGTSKLDIDDGPAPDASPPHVRPTLLLFSSRRRPRRRRQAKRKLSHDQKRPGSHAGGGRRQGVSGGGARPIGEYFAF